MKVMEKINMPSKCPAREPTATGTWATEHLTLGSVSKTREQTNLTLPKQQTYARSAFE